MNIRRVGEAFWMVLPIVGLALICISLLTLLDYPIFVTTVFGQVP